MAKRDPLKLFNQAVAAIPSDCIGSEEWQLACQEASRRAAEAAAYFAAEGDRRGSRQLAALTEQLAALLQGFAESRIDYALIQRIGREGLELAALADCEPLAVEFESLLTR